MLPISRTLAALALAAAFATAADAPRQLLPNGGFEEGDKDPAGWHGAHTGVDTENRFVRLTAAPERPTSATSTFQFGAKPPKALEFACHVRSEGAAGAAGRIAVAFRDSAGKAVLPAPAPLAVDGPAGWRQVKRRFFVPAGATAIEITASLDKAAGGTLDIDNVALIPVHPVYVPAEERFAGTVAIEAGGKAPAALHVDGNRLLDAAGAAVRLQGIAAPADPALVAMAIELWRANAVRLDLDRAAWADEAYRAKVGQAVRAAASRGAWAVLELRGEGAPSAADAAFWKTAAGAFKDEPAAVFALFQRPKGIAWDAWQSGMQSLVDAVRGAGAANLVVAEGLDGGYDLSGAKALKGEGIAYGSVLDPTRRSWQEKLLAPAAGLPVVVLDVGCPLIPAAGGEDPFTWAPDALAALQAGGVSWIAGSLAADAPNALIAANRTPSAWWGSLVRAVLGGAKLASDRKR